MAFDGITTHCLLAELRTKLLGQRISKIAQPEKEEILFTFKGVDSPNRLLISANASLPFIYMTDENKPSPMTAPCFCMLLRKHIGNGRVTAIDQPGYERVLRFKIEHLDEMGDPAIKYLYVELMGKHSNIIFCNEEDVILDSIKHVSSQVSSVREVLPGRKYFIPAQEGKTDPTSVGQDEFNHCVFDKPTSIAKAIYSSFVGISPVIAQEMAYRAGLDGDSSTSSCDENAKNLLWNSFVNILKEADSDSHKSSIYFDSSTGAPRDFSPIALSIFADCSTVSYETISELLVEFYAKRNLHNNIRQKSTDLRKIISTHLERDKKKYNLQKKQLEDTEKKDKYRIYGEMLHTYGYQVPSGAKSTTVINYYDNSELTIPLDSTLSAMENATKYFDKYGKLKRTAEALSTLVLETEAQIKHLESISAAMDIAENEADLAAIKQELTDYGFIKKHSGGKKARVEKSVPLHFVDELGYHYYVGKNNYQNDQLTLKFATGNDWWFHSKEAPGSHVIVKNQGEEMPDAVFERAASLAAYYSSARESSKVEIDYLQKKNIKKPNASAPGYVIYHTNYSMTAKPSVEGLQNV